MEQDIDWSGFDINNYPKVNYYHFLYNRNDYWYTQNIFLRPKTHGSAPNSGVEFVLLSICFILMGVVAGCFDLYLYSAIFIVTAIVLLVSIPLVHINGKRAYLQLCKEMYRDEYLKKVSKDRMDKKQQDTIKKYIDSYGEQRIICKDELHAFNNASKWYIAQGAPMGDIILLTKEEGINACLEQTQKAREYGLPDNYYVIVVKDTHWLCCNAEDECIYAFSKTIGLTHTKYQSLYEYIIDICNIPFDVENDA